MNRKKYYLRHEQYISSSDPGLSPSITAVLCSPPSRRYAGGRTKMQLVPPLLHTIGWPGDMRHVTVIPAV
jgi:hypothetical protein